MIHSPADYAPLDTESLPGRLSALSSVTDRLGADSQSWRVREIGDGNLNLVFIVESELGGVIVKQALPYVRLVGESWPLPLSRSFYEYHALTRQAERAGDIVPEVFHFDEQQALIVMEYLSPHHILRHSLQRGIVHPSLGTPLGLFCANTAFKGSDFCMDAAARKHDVGLFSGNTALCDISESLIFTDPYHEAPLNRHTSPQLDSIVADLRSDVAVKIAVQRLKFAFCSQAETLLHGDLHTGSIMVHESDVKVIDPEFALYGPIGFDIGMLMANFIMAWCAQPAYASETDNREDYQAWILTVIEDLWSSFNQQFSHLWRDQRTGILFPTVMFEAQGHEAGAEEALSSELERIWFEALGFCGAEIVRRTLGLAHIIEYDDIANPDERAACEATGLRIARLLLIKRKEIHTLQQLSERIQNMVQEPQT